MNLQTVCSALPGRAKPRDQFMAPGDEVLMDQRYRASCGMVCCCSSVVERILGKAEVGSSILPSSTIPFCEKY